MAVAPGKCDLPPTKTITVYRNGDAFFPGRKVVVNPRHVLTFDSFLNTLTKGIEAPFGAVRKLYTPVLGRKVRCLEELQHGRAYVAAGYEQFKMLGYCDITTKKPESRKKEQIQPVVHSRIIVSARWQRSTDESCTINVFTNGEVLVPPTRIRIPKFTLRSWEKVLALVTEKVHLRSGAVHRLCTLEGHAVCTSNELENQRHYVAVGAERFKALPYDQCVPGILVRDGKAYQSQGVAPPVQKTRHTKDMISYGGFSMDIEDATGSSMKKHSVMIDKTTQSKQVSRNTVLDLSTGEGSVFNAQNKRSETAGAAEVQEDVQLKVDLPIDQVEAKIVEEEYEDESCCTNSCKTPPCDSDDSCSQRSLSADSRKDPLAQSKSWSVPGSTPLPWDQILLKEATEREASSRLSTIRSRVSRFFKGRFIKA